MRKEEFDNLISRRDFLKGTLAAAATAGVLGIGSAFADDVPAAEAGKEGTGGAPSYEVYNTDLLVIGAGNNAMTAAATALSLGKNVTIIEKAMFHHGGVSGMCWDAFSVWFEPETFEEQIKTREPDLINHEAFKQALLTDAEPNKYVYSVNHGQSLPDRKPDGKINPYWIDTMCMGQFVRRETDDFRGKANANYFDQTMITDLLITNGRCYGAIGLHIPSGTLRVFRANATIFGSGGCTWLYGWKTVSAATIGSPDNTADVDMACYRHGLGIGDSEFAQYDVLGVYPDGLAYAPGGNICADAQEADSMVDKDGNPVYKPGDPNVSDRIYFCQELARVAVGEGRGTENGGVFVNIGDTQLRLSNDRNFALLEKFGINPREEMLEVCPEMYEHAGNPIIDHKMMTEVAGLFCARGAGVNGAYGGGQVHLNRYFGQYTGRCASEYIDSLSKDSADDIDWEPVYNEYVRLHEMRLRKAEDGIRPHVIRHEIQKTCGKSLGVYRTTGACEEALEEIKKIREDIAKQVVTDDSLVWNREWKEAIENYNMLDLAEMSIKATLMREETRGQYLRAEFPEQDDENWACTLVCYNRDGEMVFEKKTEWD